MYAWLSDFIFGGQGGRHSVSTAAVDRDLCLSPPLNTEDCMSHADTVPRLETERRKVQSIH